MKNFTCIICIGLSIFLSVPPLNGQKLGKTSHYYIEDENGNNQFISNKEAQKLMFSFQESKEYYNNYQGLMVMSITTIVGSVPFFGYYALQKAFEDFSTINLGPGHSVDDDKVSTTPLFIGGGLLAIGILAGISSDINFKKAIDTYNEKAGFKKAKEHTLRIAVRPGSVGVVYGF